MKKLLLLIRVLRRCGKAEKSASETSAHTGNISDLMAPVLGLAIAVGMFFAGRYLAEHQARMGSMESIFSTIMVLGCICSFFLSIPKVINHLYMSNDLDVLVTMPFTAMQIVTGKLVSVAALPMMICCGMIIPCGIGFGITAGGMSAMFWVGLVLSAILLALCMVAAAGIIIILLMRVFRFIRSRNMISILSTLLMFGLTMVYVFYSRSTATVSEEQVSQVFVSISGALSGFTTAIPVIAMSLKAMTTGEALPLLEAAGITAAAVVLVFVVARLFYFSAALGMADANGKKVLMSSEELRRSTRAQSMRRSLRTREFRTILRTPSMITNGYLYSIIVPCVIVVPLAIQMYSSVAGKLQEAGMTLDLETIRESIRSFNIGWPVWCLLIVAVMLFMSTMSVSMSVLSRGIISREGKDYYALKALPLPMETVVMVKRDVVLVFNGISGVLIPWLAFVAGAVLQIVPVWTVAASLVVGTACMVFLVDFCCLFGVRKPNLNWEAEADACKQNYPGLILLVVYFVLLLVGLVMFGDYDVDAQLMSVIGGVAAGLPVVLAFVLDGMLRKEAGQLAARF